MGQCFDGAVFGGATIPVVWPALWDVFEFVSFAVVFGANDARYRLVICDTTGSVGAVREEVGVEGESGKRDDGWERNCVYVSDSPWLESDESFTVIEVWIIELRECSTLCIVITHSGKIELLAAALSNILDILFEQA